MEQATACIENLQACHLLLESANGWMDNAEQSIENGNEIDGVKVNLLYNIILIICIQDNSLNLNFMYNFGILLHSTNINLGIG